MVNKTYKNLMQRCLDLAETALKNGDPPVGSVVVYNHKIIGEGVESGKSTNDVTNHAEILAIRDTINRGFKNHLPASTLITTHEPCVMCSYVIRHHKIQRIIYGTSVSQIGGHTSSFNLLTTDHVETWKVNPEVIGGVLKEKAEALNTLFKDKLKSR